MYLEEYEGYVFPADKRIKHKSTYCHNYYYGLHHEEVYAWSDDDNLTEYSIAGLVFAESFANEGDVLHVYDKFLEMPAAIQSKLDEGGRAIKGDWISVKERLPGDNAYYLVWRKGWKRPTIMKCRSKAGFNTHMAYGDVSHWTALPEPPKEDNDD